MEFNKNGFNAFRKDLEEAMKKVAEKHQVEIKAGRIKYSEFDFSMDLKVIKQDEQTDGNKSKFENECQWYGFKPEHYKVKFTLQNEQYELVGFNSNSPKNNCSIVSVVNGKSYKCNDSVIKKALGIEKPKSSILELVDVTHKCKYCGGTATGINTDLLCDDCKSTFGHSLYSEL